MIKTTCGTKKKKYWIKYYIKVPLIWTVFFVYVTYLKRNNLMFGKCEKLH